MFASNPSTARRIGASLLVSGGACLAVALLPAQSASAATSTPSPAPTSLPTSLPTSTPIPILPTATPAAGAPGSIKVPAGNAFTAHSDTNGWLALGIGGAGVVLLGAGATALRRR